MIWPLDTGRTFSLPKHISAKLTRFLGGLSEAHGPGQVKLQVRTAFQYFATNACICTAAVSKAALQIVSSPSSDHLLRCTDSSYLQKRLAETGAKHRQLKNRRRSVSRPVLTNNIHRQARPLAQTTAAVFQRQRTVLLKRSSGWRVSRRKQLCKDTYG